MIQTSSQPCVSDRPDHHISSDPYAGKKPFRPTPELEDYIVRLHYREHLDIKEISRIVRYGTFTIKRVIHQHKSSAGEAA